MDGEEAAAVKRVLAKKKEADQETEGTEGQGGQRDASCQAHERCSDQEGITDDPGESDGDGQNELEGRAENPSIRFAYGSELLLSTFYRMSELIMVTYAVIRSWKCGSTVCAESRSGLVNHFFPVYKRIFDFDQDLSVSRYISSVLY